MQTVNPIEFINERKLKKFHYVLIATFFIILMFEGYDVIIYGATIPLLKEDFGISTIMAGTIGSYTTIGTAIGAVVFGLYADRFGKRAIILFTTIVFSVFTLLAGFAPNVEFFIVCRVLAGLGFGGVMPNIAALISEYAPVKHRAIIISIIFIGYSVGAMIASFAGQLLLETFGWHPVYWLGGIPLLVLPLLFKIVPPAISDCLRRRDFEALRQALQKIDTISSNVEFAVVNEKAQPKSSVRQLFQQKLALSTLMFWLSCFCTFLLMYSLNTWLPTLMMNAGYDLKSSLVFVAVLQAGSIIGTLVLGSIIGRIGFKRVLVPLYLVGAVALILIGYSTNVYIAYGLIFIIGAASLGLQNMSNAYVAQYYSVDVRAAGLGSTMAFGRIGSIAAPTLVAILLTFNLQPQFNFFAIASAAILGAICMSFIRESRADYSNNFQHDFNEQLVPLTERSKHQ